MYEKEHLTQDAIVFYYCLYIKGEILIHCSWIYVKITPKSVDLDQLCTNTLIDITSLQSGQGSKQNELNIVKINVKTIQPVVEEKMNTFIWRLINNTNFRHPDILRLN